MNFNYKTSGSFYTSYLNKSSSCKCSFILSYWQSTGQGQETASHSYYIFNNYIFCFPKSSMRDWGQQCKFSCTWTLTNLAWMIPSSPNRNLSPAFLSPIVYTCTFTFRLKEMFYTLGRKEKSSSIKLLPSSTFTAKDPCHIPGEMQSPTDWK